MPAAKTVAEKIVRARVSPGLTTVQGRQIAIPNPAAKLKAIVREIDETLLPRKLTFAIGPDRQLHVDVGSRRLYQLVGAQLDQDTSALKLAFSSRDQDNLKAQLDEIAQLLVSFVRQPGAMTVVSRITSKAYRSSEVGFSATDLTAICEKLGVPDSDEAIAEAAPVPDVEIIEADESVEDELTEDAVDMSEALDAPVDELDEPAPAKVELSVEEQLLSKLAAAAKSEVEKTPAKAPAAPAAPPPPQTIEEYFEACKSCATNGVMLASDGAVLAVFGRGVQENWLDIAGHAATDFSNWIDVAGWALGKTQLLVLKGPHFEDSSIAVLFKDNKYAAITMRNLDLNKVMKLGMEVLDQGAKG